MGLIKTLRDGILSHEEQGLRITEGYYRQADVRHPVLRADAQEVQRRLRVVSTARDLFSDLRADKRRPLS